MTPSGVFLSADPIGTFRNPLLAGRPGVRLGWASGWAGRQTWPGIGLALGHDLGSLSHPLTLLSPLDQPRSLAFPDNRSAIRMAASRLFGCAMPLPAMSKAVPWSGLVRTNGSPTVRFTPSSTPRYFTGISP